MAAGLPSAVARLMRLSQSNPGQLRPATQNTKFWSMEMNTHTHKFAYALVAGMALVALAASPAVAEQRLMLHPPGDGFVPQPLPKFGFSSFNIHGYGERVTSVRWGGLASQLGLEPGDVILSMNGHRLTYQGSWNDGLLDAIEHHDGLVRLRIRDVRTGFVATRQLFVGGGHGPIEHHFKAGGNVTHNFNVTPHNNFNPMFENPSPQLQNKIINIGN
jgi:hypothetical protein